MTVSTKFLVLRSFICPNNIIENTTVGNNISIFMHFTVTYIKDQFIELFGFIDLLAKEIVLLLQSVNGVGTRMAISFLDTYSHNQIKSMIFRRSRTYF